MKLFELIGNTPLVELEHIPSNPKVKIFCKMEGQNPGGSVKDRAAYNMIRSALDRGDIKPGDRLVEATSGNTGMGLAIAAVIKGYKCIFTTTDKQSKEKVDALRAFGAEVIVCPTDVEPEDPR